MTKYIITEKITIRSDYLRHFPTQTLGKPYRNFELQNFILYKNKYKK